MEFTYRLDGMGWAEACIADGDARAILTASYLSDALGDLLGAVQVLLDGETEVRCSWQEEPGEYRWLFTRTGDEVHLRVLDFPDQFALSSDAEGVLVFETRQPLRKLAQVVAGAAAHVLATHGEEGYLRLWVAHPFPTGLLRVVQDRLRQR